MGTRPAEIFAAPAKLAIARCKRSGTSFKTRLTAYTTVWTGRFCGRRGAWRTLRQH